MIGLVFTFLTVRFRTLGPSDPTWVRRLISSFKRSSIFVDGNVETVAGGRQVFGAVTRAATDITALTQRTLETMGQTDATEVTAFTDGCPGLRTVLANAGVTRPPILDWFHIAMRLQHTKLAAANLPTDDPDRAKATIVAAVERLHWRIWNEGEECSAQHQADPQGHACLQGRVAPGHEGCGVAQAVARVACDR
ncbi:MAG: hypothetical protein JO266_01725 [Acidobacteria bacterium]|nr:hypothetical protein [Acidobacteriota bacterium]